MSVEFFTLIGVVITATTAIVVAILNVRQDRKIREIHVLVNDRLDKALAKIEELKMALHVEKTKNGV